MNFIGFIGQSKALDFRPQNEACFQETCPACALCKGQLKAIALGQVQGVPHEFVRNAPAPGGGQHTQHPEVEEGALANRIRALKALF